jgi:hypothetical protein
MPLFPSPRMRGEGARRSVSEGGRVRGRFLFDANQRGILTSPLPLRERVSERRRSRARAGEGLASPFSPSFRGASASEANPESIPPALRMMDSGPAAIARGRADGNVPE